MGMVSTVVSPVALKSVAPPGMLPIPAGYSCSQVFAQGRLTALTTACGGRTNMSATG